MVGEAPIMRWMFVGIVIAVLMLGLGFLAGVIWMSPEASLCQDALERRRQAEQALSRSNGDPFSEYQARNSARAAHQRAVDDIGRYCPAPR